MESDTGEMEVPEVLKRSLSDDPENVGVLLEALPYIREFHGRTVVIKYGGAAMRDEHLREAFATDVVLLKYVGLNPIVVHGGGPEITDYMRRLGMEVKFHDGLRVSNRETVEVAKMVLLGKVNADLVSRLNRAGQPSVGLSGEDGTLFQVAPVANAAEVGFVGQIERVDVDVLNHIAADYIPVIASSASDREGNSYNVNADDAAGKVSAALGAYKAIFLTDVVGWLEDPEDETTRISEATVASSRTWSLPLPVQPWASVSQPVRAASSTPSLAINGRASEVNSGYPPP